MSIQIHWRLPTHGDGRSLHPASWNRGDYAADRKQPHVFARTGVQRDGYTYFDQLAQIARAAELGGFDGVWIPHSAAGEETQIVAGALARDARRLRFVPALFTPLLSAVYSAKIAVSHQRLSGDRLDWNFVFEDAVPRPWHGRQFALDEQVARTDEFLTVVKGFWNQAPFTWQGRFYEVENGGFPPALQGQRLPRIHVSGDRDEALELSARHADVHVLPVLPLPDLRQRIEQLDVLAARHGRRLAYALEADIVVRHDDAAAWDELHRQWRSARQKTVPIAGAGAEAGREEFDALRAGGHLWAGFDALRPGAPLGLVGGYASIAERLAEYVDAGIGSLVLSAPPHLEEAYRFGEFVVPRLRAHANRAAALRAA